MSEFGAFVSKFRLNTNSLRQFDATLRYLRQSKDELDAEKGKDHVQKLLLVLKPITDMLSGQLSASLNLDELRIVEILNQRHNADWQTYRVQIIKLTNDLSHGRTNLDKREFEILNDVADAMDAECANLFRRINRSP